MPTINGITAFVETHNGPLEEYGLDEFPGGSSCFIPAHSGQQFWLHYSLNQPLHTKAASCEFYVDGQRVDAQFPMAEEGTDPPTLRPLESTIRSQYGKDADGNVWRRDVFFTLIDLVKTRSPKTIMAPATVAKYGTIECKVFRAEATGEWDGEVIPDEFTPGQVYKGSLKGRHVSHTVRLGAKIDAAPAKRYGVKTLDPDDAPFAWFKFFYRSRKYLESLGYGPFLETPYTGPSRALTRRASAALPASRSKSIAFSTIDNCSVAGQETADWASEATRAAESLDATVRKLEEDLIIAGWNAEQTGKLLGCHEKVEQLRKSTEQISRLRKNGEQARDSKSDQVPEDPSSESGSGSKSKDETIKGDHGVEASGKE